MNQELKISDDSKGQNRKSNSGKGKYFKRSSSAPQNNKNSMIKEEVQIKSLTTKESSKDNNDKNISEDIPDIIINLNMKKINIKSNENKDNINNNNLLENIDNKEIKNNENEENSDKRKDKENQETENKEIKGNNNNIQEVNKENKENEEIKGVEYDQKENKDEHKEKLDKKDNTKKIQENDNMETDIDKNNENNNDDNGEENQKVTNMDIEKEESKIDNNNKESNNENDNGLIEDEKNKENEKVENKENTNKEIKENIENGNIEKTNEENKNISLDNKTNPSSTIPDNNIQNEKEIQKENEITSDKIENNNNTTENDKKEEKKPEISLSEKIKLYETPYDKLDFLSKEIGFETMVDYIINIINNNKSNSISYSYCDNTEIETLVKNVLRQLTEQALYTYLMKILAIQQKQNIEILTDFKLSLDSKLRSRASVSAVSDGKFVGKKRDFDLVMKSQTQYRSKHFYYLGGEIYCYIPKHYIKSFKCFLYCSKNECKAKLYLDMGRKKGRVYGNHSHEGIDVEKYEKDFPEIKEENWEHIQYDVKLLYSQERPYLESRNVKDRKYIFVWKT